MAKPVSMVVNLRMRGRTPERGDVRAVAKTEHTSFGYIIREQVFGPKAAIGVSPCPFAISRQSMNEYYASDTLASLLTII